MGFETNEILSAMPAMLDLAGAGQIDLAAAADISSNILSGFGMEADQAGHMANVLAKAASSANTDVGQLGEAMKYLGPSAHALGWNIEESAAAVMTFSDAGIQGSMAGRAFASSLQRLAKPTKQMQDKMEELGVEFFDAQGNMKPMTEIVGDLEDSFEGLSSEQQANALTTLFGAEAFKHWSVLVEKGADDLSEMEKGLINSDNAAKNMRETMEDNLHGDIAKFTSALAEMGIIIYKAVGPSLRSLVKYLTKVVEWVSNLSPETQKMIVGFIAFLAVLGPVILILGKFAMAIGAMITLGAKFMGIFGTVIGVVGKLGGALSGAGAMFARFLPMLLRFATMIPRLFNPIGLAITLFLVVWKLLLKALGISTKEAIGILINGIIDGAKKIGEWLFNLGSAIVGGLMWLIQSAVGLFQAFLGVVVNAVVAFASLLKTLWSSVINVIIAFIVKAVALFVGFVMRAVSLFTELYTKAKAIIGRMVTAVLNGFTKMVNGAIKAGKGIVSAIVGAFKKAWNGALEFVGKAASLGLDFAKGIANGIKSGARFLKSAIVGIGKLAVTAFKDFFKMKSPSRLMAEEGKWIPAGAAKGIADNADVLTGAMKTVGNVVQDGYNKAIRGVSVPSLPSIGNILPQTRRMSVANATTGYSERVSSGSSGDINVNVRKIEDVSPQTIQNKVERKFFSKARQRE